jgi:DtxR family Mn-dependent transcriptional regulator
MKAKTSMAITKDHNLSASLEDYLEAIFNIAGDSKVAHSKDIAELLGVSRASVTGALRVLKDKGLANYKPYGCISLTEAGRVAAAEVARKHNILKSFFINVLGIDSEIAHRAACKAEHALGREVISRLLGFIDFVTQQNKDGYDLAGKFRRFYSDASHQASSKVARRLKE